jgi:26S proteasome regulatory subunit N2
MIQFVSVAGLVGLLDEADQSLQTYALKQLDQLVNEYWAEIADSVPKMLVFCHMPPFLDISCGVLFIPNAIP